MPNTLHNRQITFLTIIDMLIALDVDDDATESEQLDYACAVAYIKLLAMINGIGGSQISKMIHRNTECVPPSVMRQAWDMYRVLLGSKHEFTIGRGDLLKIFPSHAPKPTPYVEREFYYRVALQKHYDYAPIILNVTGVYEPRYTTYAWASKNVWKSKEHAQAEYECELAKRDTGKTALLEGLARNVGNGELVPSLNKAHMWAKEE